MQNPPPPPPPGGYAPPPPQMSGGYQPVAYAAPASYGGFWIRVVAYIIDAIILGIIGGILSVPLGVSYSDMSSLSSPAARTSNGIDLVLSLVYFVGLWTYMGGSIGQRIFGMRVVDATTGQPVGLGKAVIRWLGLLLSFFVCGIGVIWVAFDARKQGWMDKIAGTVVVRS
ncbi:MAG TPA: RDD family protein [Candidatus Dormibacteraeota bacterium]